jgi:hypothetical protein
VCSPARLVLGTHDVPRRFVAGEASLRAGVEGSALSDWAGEQSATNGIRSTTLSISASTRRRLISAVLFRAVGALGSCRRLVA